MADEDELYPTYTLEFVTGDTVRRRIQMVDPDPDSPDPDNPVLIPRNLTGWSGRAQIRKSTKKDAPLITTFTLTGFGSDGYMYMYLPPSESKKVTRSCGWDLELTDPSGDVETVLGGPVEPKGEYTQ
jgi:hypothetical protein